MHDVVGGMFSGLCRRGIPFLYSFLLLGGLCSSNCVVFMHSPLFKTIIYIYVNFL